MKKAMLASFITLTMIIVSGDILPVDPIASVVKKEWVSNFWSAQNFIC